MGGAKYHVSEILGKLGVESREDAARWQPAARPWWVAAGAPITRLWHRAGSGPLPAAITAGVALLVAAGIALLVWGLLRTSGGTPSPAEPATALVHLGGTIDSISDQQLVLRDLEGHLVNIRLEHAQGPEAYFCDHRTPIPLCMVLNEAAPTVGEHVCVLAHLMPPGDLLAWFVMLDSQCQQVPAS